MEPSHSAAPLKRCSLFDLDQVARAFGADFLDAGRCAAFVLEQLHQGEAKCPRCQAELQGPRRETFQGFGRVSCRACGKWFSVTTGTPLHKVKLNPRQLVIVAYLLAIGVDLARIAAAAGVDVETARTWQLKFRALAPGEGGGDGQRI